MQTVVTDGGRAEAPEAPRSAVADPGAAPVPPARDPGGGGSSFWSPRGADGTVAAGWYLLPLRLFLGVTFVFAGLQKIANPAFFKAGATGSIHAQLAGAARSSPIHLLLSHLVGASAAIGWTIAVAEVAVGLGMLVGLWTRIAALGGMLLSLSLFLAVSFHTAPYYLGSDIVFLFAWTPLLLAGAAGAPSFDTWLALQAAEDGAADRASRRPDVPAVAGPVEAGPDGSVDGVLARREVVSRGAIAGLVAAGVVALGGVAAAAGRVAGRTQADQPTAGSLPAGTTPPTAAAGSGGSSSGTASPSGTSIGAASGVPAGGSATFTVPSSGDPGLVIHQPSGQFTAFDAVCPHAGCTVAYQASAKIIACPCHGSEFNPHNGRVVRGPATYGLTRIAVTKGPNGDLYVPE